MILWRIIIVIKTLKFFLDAFFLVCVFLLDSFRSYRRREEFRERVQILAQEQKRERIQMLAQVAQKVQEREIELEQARQALINDYLKLSCLYKLRLTGMQSTNKPAAKAVESQSTKSLLSPAQEVMSPALSKKSEKESEKAIEIAQNTPVSDIPKRIEPRKALSNSVISAKLETSIVSADTGSSLSLSTESASVDSQPEKFASASDSAITTMFGKRRELVRSAVDKSKSIDVQGSSSRLVSTM